MVLVEQQLNEPIVYFVMPKNSNRSNQRSIAPLIGLFKAGPKPQIKSVGVQVECADGKVRSIALGPKLAAKLLEFIKHKQGGQIILLPHQDEVATLQQNEDS